MTQAERDNLKKFTVNATIIVALIGFFGLIISTYIQRIATSSPSPTPSSLLSEDIQSTKRITVHVIRHVGNQDIAIPHATVSISYDQGIPPTNNTGDDGYTTLYLGAPISEATISVTAPGYSSFKKQYTSFDLRKSIEIELNSDIPDKGTPSPLDDSSSSGKPADTDAILRALTDQPFTVDEEGKEAIVMLHNIPVMAYSTSCKVKMVDGTYKLYTPKDRAKATVVRLNDISTEDIPKKNFPVTNLLDAKSNGTPIVYFDYVKPYATTLQGDLIVTVDEKMARGVFHTDGRRASCWLRDVIRDWLLISLGKEPEYTVLSTPILKEFYDKLNHNTVPTQDDFQSAAADLAHKSGEKHFALFTLFRTIPSKYNPPKSDPYCRYHDIVDPHLADESTKTTY